MVIATHVLAGAGLGIAFAPNVVCVAAAMAGSLVPDRLDTMFSFGSERRWRKIHRTWSHNLGWWLVPALVWLLFWPYDFGKVGAVVMDAAVFCYLGAMSHLALDFLNPTGIGLVPFFSKMRVGLGIVRTGSAVDGMTGLLIVVLAILWRVHAGLDFRNFFFFARSGM